MQSKQRKKSTHKTQIPENQHGQTALRCYSWIGYESILPTSQPTNNNVVFCRTTWQSQLQVKLTLYLKSVNKLNKKLKLKQWTRKLNDAVRSIPLLVWSESVPRRGKFFCWSFLEGRQRTAGVGHNMKGWTKRAKLQIPFLEWHS